MTRRPPHDPAPPASPRSLIAAAALPGARPATSALSQSYTRTRWATTSRCGPEASFGVVAGLEASTLVYYDRKDAEHRFVHRWKRRGRRGRQAGDRSVRERSQRVRRALRRRASTGHGTLSENDVTLIYFNDGGDGSPFEVVRREKQPVQGWRRRVAGGHEGVT